MPDRKNIHVRVIHSLVAVLAGQGVDVASFLGLHGLTPGELWDPATRISHTTLVALWRAAAARDPQIGLQAAELARNAMTLAKPDPGYIVALMLFASPTVGAALERVVRNFAPLNMPLVRFTIQPMKDASYRVALDIEGPTTPALEDFLFWPVLPLARFTGVETFEPVAVHFPYERPGSIDIHRRLFGSGLHFNQRGTAFVLSADQWRLPLLTSDPATLQLLDERAAEVMDPGDLAARVRLLLGDAGARPPTVDDAAKRLGISARTLTRRLADLGTSYRALSEEVRRSRAHEALEGRTLAEAAPLLGYSDERALRRALQRWKSDPS